MADQDNSITIPQANRPIPPPQRELTIRQSIDQIFPESTYENKKFINELNPKTDVKARRIVSSLNDKRFLLFAKELKSFVDFDRNALANVVTLYSDGTARDLVFNARISTTTKIIKKVFGSLVKATVFEGPSYPQLREHLEQCALLVDHPFFQHKSPAQIFQELQKKFYLLKTSANNIVKVSDHLDLASFLDVTPAQIEFFKNRSVRAWFRSLSPTKEYSTAVWPLELSLSDVFNSSHKTEYQELILKMATDSVGITIDRYRDIYAVFSKYMKGDYNIAPIKLLQILSENPQLLRAANDPDCLKYLRESLTDLGLGTKLRTISAKAAVEILNSKNNEKKLVELNTLMRDFGGLKNSYVVQNLEEKVELLSYLKSHGFSRQIKFREPKDPSRWTSHINSADDISSDFSAIELDPEKLKAVYASLKSGEARIILDALIRTNPSKSYDLVGFIKAISEPKKVRALKLYSERADIRELLKELNTKSKGAIGDSGELGQFADTVAFVEKLSEKYFNLSTPLRSTVVDILEDLVTNGKLFSHYFNQFLQNLGSTADATGLFSLLRSEFRFSSSDIYELVSRSSEGEDILARINVPNFKLAFERLTKLCEASQNRGYLMVVAIQAAKRNDLPSLTKALFEFSKNIPHVIEESELNGLASNRTFREPKFWDDIQTVEFRKFSEGLLKKINKNKANLSDLGKLYYLFTGASRERLKDVDNPVFVKTVDWLTERAKRDEKSLSLCASMFESVLLVGDALKTGEFEGFLDKMELSGTKVNFEELPTLSTIFQNGKYRRLLFSRKDLEEEVNSRLVNITPQERSSLSYPAELDEKIAKLESHQHRKKMELEQLRKRYLATYTEKPDIRDLDSLILVKGLMLMDTLEQRETLAELGKIVSADLKDRSTEYGGAIVPRGNRLQFRSVPSANFLDHDGTYYISLPRKYLGISDFHLHALRIDDWQQSGPSGSAHHGGGGDFDFTDGSSQYGRIVATTIGRPVDRYGKEDKSKVLIDIDLFWKDPLKNDVIHEGGRILDLGSYAVPVN